MLRAGAGLSTDRDAECAATEAARAALASGALERADLVLVFVTTPHGPGFTRVTRTVSEICGTRDVVGCSAAGVLAGEEEVEGGPAVAVLALAGAIAPRRFMVPIARGLGARAAEQLAEAVGPGRHDGALLLLFADTYNLEADPFFAGLASHLPGVRVIGGGASEDGSVGEVSVFAGDSASSRAVSGALLGGDVRATIGVTQALQRVGPVYRITAVDGAWVLRLDDRPAWEAFRNVVPEALLADPRRALSAVLAGVGEAEDEFVARHLAGFDVERGAVGIAGAVLVGDRLFFGIRDPRGARVDLERMVAAQAATWSETPAAALYINCVGRGRAFHGVAGLDTAYIRRGLGAIPLAGFFSGAEFAQGSGGVRLHQYTGVLGVLGTRH